MILPEIVRVTKIGGSICWQVGYHVMSGVVIPLDYLVHTRMTGEADVQLRNRIIWTYGHGEHAKRRFSGRHEVILWYTKGDNYYFDLDSVRVRQKYPGKTHYKGLKRGQPSGNPLGKNPSDVWDIPNVKANHVEKTDHPCQYPVGLAIKLIRALSPEGGRVLDPYAGSGSTGAAAVTEGRRFIGAELNEKYFGIATQRLFEATSGTLRYRPWDKPIFLPSPTSAVAIAPSHFVGA